MAVSNHTLRLLLHRLEAGVPGLIAKYLDPGKLISEFSGQADSIVGHASSADVAWTLRAIDRILAANGLPASKYELPPHE